VQHLCVQSPDRADVRGHVASAVITIIQHMRTTATASTSAASTASADATAAGGSANSSERTRCLRFLARAAKSPKLAHRYFNHLHLVNVQVECVHLELFARIAFTTSVCLIILHVIKSYPFE
jgi:hypothetical protein